MALHDLANSEAILPSQIVLDSSFLLALRPLDDNPHAAAAQAFARRLRPRVQALELAVWLVMPVLQECYHIILTGNLRRVWQAMEPQARPANWLALYKQMPETLQKGFAAIEEFDTLLATFPVTLARPDDLSGEPTAPLLEERLRYFIGRYHLLPQDALILAEAERMGITAVATLDRDWRRVTEFDVYTTPL